jgi:hypothetical protein
MPLVHKPSQEATAQTGHANLTNLVQILPLEDTLHRPKDLFLSNFAQIVVDLEDGGLKVEALLPNPVSTTQQFGT